jgi:hypothetical protein
MVRIAITEAITTLAEAERRFNLSQLEDERFFSEWQIDLPELSTLEQTSLDEGPHLPLSRGRGVPVRAG